jgi:hypothetical protein
MRLVKHVKCFRPPVQDEANKSDLYVFSNPIKNPNSKIAHATRTVSVFHTHYESSIPYTG